MSQIAEETFKACDIFLNQTPNLHCSFDSIRSTLASLQKRWNNICSKSQERLHETDQLHKDWKEFNDAYNKLQLWIKEKACQISAIDVDSSKVTYEDLEQIEEKLEALKTEQNDKLPELDTLNDLYCDLAREYRLDTSDDLKSKFIKVKQNAIG